MHIAQALRDAFVGARDSGVHLAFLSANEGRSLGDPTPRVPSSSSLDHTLSLSKRLPRFFCHTSSRSPFLTHSCSTSLTHPIALLLSYTPSLFLFFTPPPPPHRLALFLPFTHVD